MERAITSRRWAASLLMAMSLGAVCPMRALAQATGSRTASGTMANGLAFEYISRSIRQGRDGREWLSAVILWRMPPHSTAGEQAERPDTAILTAAERRFRELQRAAEDSGRSFLGGSTGAVIQNAAVSRSIMRTLWVEGEMFPVPERDSALVVLVDLTGAPAMPARIVGHAYISAELPDAFWPKPWASADTTFIAHVREAHAILLQALRADPIVRAFVDSGDG